MAKEYEFYGEQPLVFAHRGASDVAPENTLAAFRAAIEADADGIELDVTRCLTGEIVVIHDDTLDRTTNGSGPVASIPFYALRELDAGSWFAPEYASERIPTLREALDLVGHRLRIQIEIKGRDLRGNGIEEEIAEAIRARGLEERVLIISFNPMSLIRMKRVAPELQRGLLYGPDLPIYLARAWARPMVAPHALHPHYSTITEDVVRRARRRGYRINAWTVDTPEAMRRMIDVGVDAMTTNHPAQLRELLPR